MARIWSSGFELQSVTSGVEWDTTTGSPAIDTTIKRSGTASLLINAASESLAHRFRADAATKYFIRFYLYITSLPAFTVTICDSGDGFYMPIDMRLTSGGVLQMFDDEDIQIGSDSPALSISTWYRIEISYDDSNVNNLVTARIDGVDFVTDEIGPDVANGGVARFGTLNAVAATFYIDDIAINDTSGSYQNSWPGAGSIVHMHPNAAGDAAATAGIFADIDEVTPDDATSYIEVDTAIPANYNFESSADRGIGALDTITLVQAGTRQRPETAASAAWTPQIKSQSGGTTESGTSTTHNDTTWKTNGDVLPRVYKLTSYVDPQAGGAWTPALLDTMIVGVNVTDATPDLWFSTIWVLVEHVPAAPPAVAEKSRAFIVD